MLFFRLGDLTRRNPLLVAGLPPKSIIYQHVTKRYDACFANILILVVLFSFLTSSEFLLSSDIDRVVLYCLGLCIVYCIVSYYCIFVLYGTLRYGMVWYNMVWNGRHLISI